MSAPESTSQPSSDPPSNRSHIFHHSRRRIQSDNDSSFTSNIEDDRENTSLNSSLDLTHSVFRPLEVEGNVKQYPIPFDLTAIPKRPFKVFQPDVVPVGGASVTIDMQSGCFVTGTGARVKASDQALKLRADWLEGLRKVEQEMKAKAWKKHVGQNKKDNKEHVPEHFFPAELPSDADELYKLGNTAGTGKFFDDVMEGAARVEFLDGGVDPLNPPNPVENVQDSDLPMLIKKNLEKMDIVDFMGIQRHVIPIVRMGYDVIGCAPTGSGKSAAFLVPIIHALYADSLRQELLVPVQKPRALILVPTRELAAQLKLMATQIAFGTNISAFALYGAIDSELVRSKIECDILIATPGRMMEVVQKRILHLSGLIFVVVVDDEADRMFQKSSPEVKAILEDSSLPSVTCRQTLFFSATVPYHQIPLWKRHQNRVFSVKIGDDGPVQSVEHVFKKCIGYGEKMQNLRKVFDEAANELKSVLVFGQSISMVERLTTELRYLNVVAIHSHITQADREEKVRKFTSKECTILLATDIFQRGLDIAGVDIVVNFGMPQAVHDYIHRVGRTARKGHGGKAFSFLDPTFRRDAKIIVPLVLMLRACQVEIPTWLLDEFERRQASYTLDGGELDENESPPSDAEDLPDMNVFVKGDHDSKLYEDWGL